MKKNDIHTGTVSGYGTDGEGIINVEGTTAFVPFCLDGEEVSFKVLKAKDNIAYGKPDATEEEIVAAAKRANIHDTICSLENGYDTYIGEHGLKLSGGQRQRVAFARALAPSPQLLLLDEPFAAIDAKVRRELRTWLKDMIDRVKITSIFVTHDQEEAMEVAGTIILTNQGRIEQIGTPEEICKNPKTEFVADFIDVKLGTGHF